MIIYTDTNLFLSPAQTLVNTVNTDGVMGKGIAKDFKHYYPQMFAHYKLICRQGELSIGKLMLSKGEPVIWRKKITGKERKRWVLNFPTKRHWRAKSKIEYLEAGLNKFVNEYAQRGIKSVAFPQLGVGNGGLEWKKVREIMENYLGDLDIPVYVHIYHSHTDYYDNEDKKAIEENLNVAHDAWQKGKYILKEKLNYDKNVNIDGIVLPGNTTFDKIQHFSNIKHFNLLNHSSSAVWLQELSGLKENHQNFEQLNLGI